MGCGGSIKSVASIVPSDVEEKSAELRPVTDSKQSSVATSSYSTPDRRNKNERLVPLRSSTSEFSGLLNSESLDSGDEDDDVVAQASASDRRFLQKVLQKHFIFAGLDIKDMDGLIDRMRLIEVLPGEVIFKQGSEGDCCYIIARGTFIVTIGSRNITTMGVGQTFGELAMLYKAERSATLTCSISPNDSIKGGLLWIIKGRSMRRYKAVVNERNRKRIIKFLCNEEKFASTSQEDKERLAEICDVQMYSENELFMREGEKGGFVLVIASGKAETLDKFGNANTVQKGAILGEIGFARTREHDYCAKALSKLTVLSFATETLQNEFGSFAAILAQSALKSVLARSKFFPPLTQAQQAALVTSFEDCEFKYGQRIVTHNSQPQLVVIMDGSAVLLSSNAGDNGDTIAGKERNPNEDDRGETDVDTSQTPRRGSISRCLDQLIKHESVRVLGPRHFHGDENLLSGDRMVGSLICTSEMCTIRRISLEQLLSVCVPSSEKIRGKIDNLQNFITLNSTKSALADIFIFKSITPGQLERVAYALKEVSYKPGQMIFKQGESAREGLFLITEGSLSIEVNGKVLRTLGKWDYFGERALLLNEVRSADCIASSKEGCKCLVLNTEIFLEIVGKFRKVLENRIKIQDTNINFRDLRSGGIVGKGTFGVVKLMHHKNDLTLRYALKCICKKTAVNMRQQRFLVMEREINAQCFHPCIMQFIRTFQDSQNIYFLTEFLGGGDLFSAIRDIGMLNKAQIQFFSGSIILAIDYLHERAIMYRDLKPENVMLDEEGNTKLVDFGCCRQASRTYTLVGTPEYLAPEVILARGYNHSADWWSLGVMIYEFACGPLPFGKDSGDQLELYRQIMEAPLVFPDYVTDVHIVDLMSSLLQRLPSRRIGTGPKGGKKLKSHEYFNDFDWDAIAGGYANQPWKPKGNKAVEEWEQMEDGDDGDDGSGFDMDDPKMEDAGKSMKGPIHEWCKHF